MSRKELINLYNTILAIKYLILMVIIGITSVGFWFIILSDTYREIFLMLIIPGLVAAFVLHLVGLVLKEKI